MDLITEVLTGYRFVLCVDVVSPSGQYGWTVEVRPDCQRPYVARASDQLFPSATAAARAGVFELKEVIAAHIAGAPPISKSDQ
ncbi:hypothetical protein [Bordetella genomosp. 9]|uniref:hypothetical protein n=1 Tax=Bordetella genomosp. 9 TaxID=1416803 RepID=UPI0011779584|nr:hypothetical protein [Bordetella genomosp. 9]